MIFKKVSKFIFIFFLSVSIIFSLLLFGLKQVLEQSTIKTFVIEKVQNILNLTLNYESIDTIIFPFPGIQMKGLKLQDRQQNICKAEELAITFDLSKILNSEFQIRSVQLDDSEIYLERLEDGSFPLKSKFKSDAEEIEKGKEKIDEGPKALFRLLPKTVLINNLKVHFEDRFFNQKSDLYLTNLNLSIDVGDTKANLNIDGDINQNKFHIHSETGILEDNWNINSIVTQTTLDITDFRLAKMGDLIQIFPKVDLSETKFDANIIIEKELGEKISVDLKNFSLGGIKNKKGDIFPILTLETFFDLNSEESQVDLKKLYFEYKDTAQLSVSGKLLKDKDKNSAFWLKSDNFDVEKTLLMAKLFSEIDFTKSAYFQKTIISNQVPDKRSIRSETSIPNFSFDLDTKKIKVSGKYISYLKGPIFYQNSLVSFKNLQIGIFDGNVNSTGTLDLKSGQLSTKSKLVGINVEKAISSATKDKLLKGRLRSNLSLDMNIKSKEPDRTLKLHSDFHIDKGQLLGYANFIKPVAEVGKLFNFSGGKGESTEFEAIDGSVSMYNQNLNLHTFEMKGVGLNASGKGVYNQSGKIDMKFTVSFAGMVGKAVKLPIIYRGYYGKNFAFIDPVWLATVYTGTMMGGPLGTVLGSMAGSQASDQVEETIGGVKNTLTDIKGFFWSESKEPKNKK